MSYLMDANVFIEAKNSHYGFDFCPAFWDWIDRSHQAGTVFSVESVRTELAAGGDDLSAWAQQRPGLFLHPDAAVVPSLQATSMWANGQNYDPAGIATFLAAADFFLVAHAHAYGHTVVTREIFSTSIKKIKIPNVCIGMGVQFMTPFQMLRGEQARFVLSPAP